MINRVIFESYKLRVVIIQHSSPLAVSGRCLTGECIVVDIESSATGAFDMYARTYNITVRYFNRLISLQGDRRNIGIIAFIIAGIPSALCYGEGAGINYLSVHQHR